MTELRGFVARHAKRHGDRTTFLDLHLAEAVDSLTLESYREFRNLCSDREWRTHEPRLAAALVDADEDEQLKIHMERGEFDRATDILCSMRYPVGPFDDDGILKVASKLERKYPERLLEFYLSGLGRLERAMDRRAYARKAAVAKKVKHMWVKVMKQPERWEAFARRIKAANRGRPAFQQEFAARVPGWDRL